ncbi:MAG: T9SS type A sorting domain-containing protein [Crocinitomicaceae bacterium]|nr:T9SS type A sorting domain-containing protein [Crocinitomicaceae bacterium]
MKLFLPVAFVFLNSTTILAQYCTSVGPVSTADSNLQSFSLSGELGSSISFTGCPGVLGLDDQTSTEIVNLTAGNSYSALAHFGTCGGNYYGVGSAWIDYNLNQIFEASELIGSWSGTPPVAATAWNFTVPLGAVSGTTRLRVVHFEGGSLPIDPCATFNWGSTTDFTVNIVGGADCTGTIGESTDDPRLVSSLPFSESHNNAVCYFNLLPVYSSADVFYQVLPQQLSLDFMTVSLCGSTIDTYLTIIDETGNVIAYNDDNASCGTGSKIHLNVENHDTIYVVVQGYGAETGYYNILIEQELVSISESDNESNLKVYPNPASKQVTIFSDGNNIKLNLYSVSGKLIQSAAFDTYYSLSLENLVPGVYLVQVQNDNGLYITKLIVE